MLSALFITTLLIFGLCVVAVLTLVGKLFGAAFSLAWWPLKIVGVLFAGVVLLAVGLPVMAVAIPVAVVVAVIGLPLLIIGGLLLGGLGLVGLA